MSAPGAGIARRIEGAWRGTTSADRALVRALMPLAELYRAVVGVRGRLYDAGALRSHGLALPALSIGNLTVGGTGKTPIAAWAASALRARGGRPAIVLRGYGDDEPLVHAALNPDVPVIATADRVEGARRARDAGADVVVLDDAFQHRRARRDADVVLLSADAWTGSARLLPAGPFREPLSALSRASLAVITRKAASDAAVELLRRAIAHAAPQLPVAEISLAVGALVPVATRATVQRTPSEPTDIAGTRLLAIAAIGDPTAFKHQLRALGADVELAAFPDHHAYTHAEARKLAEHAVRDGRRAVCTLKDAVKLAPLWPPSPLWYVSQRVSIERGEQELHRLLDRLLAHRAGAFVPG